MMKSAQRATPATPASGYSRLYTKSDGLWYYVNSDGVEKAVPPVAGAGVCQFRLSLTTGVPVTVTDVTGATTIYCTPFRGNQIDLYTGTTWVRRSSAEFSLALGTLTSGKPYDVFCYDNAGTPTLEFLVWTNDGTRATALTTQDGVLVKTGATTRRYLGTFYTTSTTTTEDSLDKRLLFNYYNQVDKPMYYEEGTTSWNYTTATLRQANANSAYKLQVMQGVAEHQTYVVVDCMAANTSGAGGADLTIGIGIDSTTTDSANEGGGTHLNLGASVRSHLRSAYRGVLSAGYHYIAPLEHSDAVGTTTWYGTQVGVGRKHRIVATVKV